MDALLQVRGIAGPSHSAATADVWWHSLDVDVRAGDVVLLRGPSGVGKSTLLKKIANLVPAHDDEQVWLRGRRPHEGPDSTAVNAARYRSQVLYVSQRAPTMHGSPDDFLRALMRLHVYDGASTLLAGMQSVVAMASRAMWGGSAGDVESQAAIASASTHGPGWRIDDDEEAATSVAPTHFVATGEAEQMSRALGVPSILWTRPWSSLSGGEAQRMSLCIALLLALRPRANTTTGVLLLDEPTSALDDDTAQRVERLLLHAKPLDKLALIWITHSDQQAVRVRRLASASSRRVRTLHLGTGTGTAAAGGTLAAA